MRLGVGAFNGLRDPRHECRDGAFRVKLCDLCEEFMRIANTVSLAGGGGDGNSQPADCPIAAGNYSITMPLGEKKVEIYWTKGGAATVDTASQGSEKIVTLVPPKYNVESTMTVTIEKGEAEKNFELTSR